MTKTKRGKPESKQGELFDNKPVAKPAKLPFRILHELINVYGMPEDVARGLPVNVAWARWYGFRDGKELTPETRAAKLREIAERIGTGSRNKNWTNRELIDAITEAACVMDRGFLNRVAAGLAAAIVKEFPDPEAPKTF